MPTQMKRKCKHTLKEMPYLCYSIINDASKIGTSQMFNYRVGFYLEWHLQALSCCMLKASDLVPCSWCVWQTLGTWGYLITHLCCCDLEPSSGYRVDIENLFCLGLRRVRFNLGKEWQKYILFQYGPLWIKIGNWIEIELGAVLVFTFCLPMHTINFHLHSLKDSLGYD